MNFNNGIEAVTPLSQVTLIVLGASLSLSICVITKCHSVVEISWSQMDPELTEMVVVVSALAAVRPSQGAMVRTRKPMPSARRMRCLDNRPVCAESVLPM